MTRSIITPADYQFKRMNMAQIGEGLAIEPLTLGTWSKQLDQKASEEPMQRRYHSTIYHKSSIYIYGGLPREQAEDHYNEQRTIYRYNTQGKIWTKTLTNFLNNNSFSYIFAHSTIIYNNMMYLFGGVNYKNGTQIVGLWCLNLESYNWKRQELKGYSPIPRQHASMVLHQRNMIVLYGGRSGNQNLNDMHIYKIENKLWMQIDQSSYDLKISCRLKPALASAGDYIYIFGGERQISDEDGTKSYLLRDFYQMKFLYRPMCTKPDVWIKEIITNLSPSERAGTMLSMQDKYLILWGGENTINGKRVNDIGFWIYNINEVNWYWARIKGNIEHIPTGGYSLNFGSDKFFIFGQYADQHLQSGETINVDEDVPKSKNSGLLIFNLDLKEIDGKFSDNKHKAKPLDVSDLTCHDCIENTRLLSKGKFSEFSILKQVLNEKLEFVFSAFGLLVDNSWILQAKDCRILFHHTFKEKYCLIEDNGNTSNLWDTNNDFITDLLIFRTYVEENIDQLEEMKEQDITKKNFMKEENNHPPEMISNANNSKESKEQKELKEKEKKDKEEEKQLRKRKEEAKRAYRKRVDDRKQFSRNIKLGALRIGDRVIFINKFGPNNQNRRVFVIEKAENLNKQYTYRAYYYIYENNNIVDPNMEPAKRYIDEQYKIYFKISNERKDLANNFVFITNLREIINEGGQVEPELKESAKHSDVFCCQKRQLESLEDGILIESIDFSLKNYLSLLYLKSDDLKITLMITEHKSFQISNLQIFEKIDNMVKTEKIIDLEQALDLSNCKIIEVYYNKANNNRIRDLNRKTATFHFLNGVLLYHKNRLICRYKFSLGQVNKLFKNKIKSIQQILIMFGFIEIKEEFTVNIFKTSFVRDDLLEQIYHRLKFVEKYAERFLKQSIDPKQRPFEQRNDKNEPRKRFKPNEDGKDDISNHINSNQIINID